MELRGKSVINMRRVSKDFIFNIIASIILTGTMQLLVYPFFAQHFTDGEYGVFMTIIGFVNTITSTLGTSLNNTRLIMNNDYLRQKKDGDFNLILLIVDIVVIFFVFLLSFYYFECDFGMCILVTILAVLMVDKTYCMVEYRLTLNFVNVLKCNFLGAIGYILGIFLVCVLQIVEIWPFIFILSELFSFVFVLKTTHVIKEPIEKTNLVKITLRKYLIIIVSTGFGSIMTYFDRFFLYPLMGSVSVTIYTISSFFGKSLSILMLPISNVLLGYYAQKDYEMTKSQFYKTFIIVLSLSLIFFVISLVISPVITGILYPNQINDATYYMPFANGAAILSISCLMLQTSILKFAPTYYQIVKEGLYAIVYFTLGIILCNFFGLTGFCIAAIIANVLKLIIIFFMGRHTLKGDKEILEEDLGYDSI